MNFSQAFSSVIQLLLTSLLLALGGFLLSIPFASSFRGHLIELLSYNPFFFFKLGLGVIALGAFLFLGFFRINNRRYYRIKMGAHKAFIDQALIREYIMKYWKDSFPNEDSAIEVKLSPKNRIEIEAHFLAPKDDGLISRIENELEVLLARHFNYKDEFYLTIFEK
ncbi:MAG: hypothetical protein WDZ28_01555 [Simkaniaceae bacterium]